MSTEISIAHTDEDDGLCYSSGPITTSQTDSTVYGAVDENFDNDDEDGQEDDTRYDLDDLVNRCYVLMTSNVMRDKYLEMAMPEMNHQGGARMVFANVNLIATQLNRSLEHLCQRLASELGVEYSINEKNQMVLRGKHHTPKIQSLLRQYIQTFVRCSSCQSLKTYLTKQNGINFVSCYTCESNTPIRKGV